MTCVTKRVFFSHFALVVWNPFLGLSFCAEKFLSRVLIYDDDDDDDDEVQHTHTHTHNNDKGFRNAALTTKNLRSLFSREYIRKYKQTKQSESHQRPSCLRDPES